MEATRTEFTEVISAQYNEYCKSREVEPTSKGFAEYLVNRTIVTDLTINRFLVIDKYPGALSQNMGIKRAACWDLEDIVGLKYPSIRLIIKRFATAFRMKSRLIPKT